MISFKDFYIASNIASAEYVFPKDEGAVRSFFESNKLLSHFTEEQRQHAAQSLTGKSVDLLGVMIVLERSVQLEIKKREGMSREEIFRLKKDVLATRNFINEKAIAVLGIAGINAEPKQSISIEALPFSSF